MMMIANTMKSDFYISLRFFFCVVSSSIVFQALTINQFRYITKHDETMSLEKMQIVDINWFTQDLWALIHGYGSFTRWLLIPLRFYYEIYEQGFN